MISENCSVFGIAKELGNGILRLAVSDKSSELMNKISYACHQFEHSSLRKLKQFDNFVERFSHGLIIRVCADHATVEAISQGMINV